MNPTTRLFWACALVTILNALTSAGFSMAALSSSDEAHVNALYTVSRSLSLVAASLLVAGLRSRTGLLVLLKR